MTRRRRRAETSGWSLKMTCKAKRFRSQRVTEKKRKKKKEKKLEKI